MAGDFVSSFLSFVSSADTLQQQLILFIIAVVIGFVLAKALKMLIVVGLVVLAGYYFGFISINREKLEALVSQYGSQLIHGALLATSSAVLIVGLLIGFVVGMLR